jgi:pimeloyl-ACP methyl ester carboxylesterase
MAGDLMHGRLHSARRGHIWRNLIIVITLLAVCLTAFALTDRVQASRVNRQYGEPLNHDVQNLVVDGIRISYREMGASRPEDQSGDQSGTGTGTGSGDRLEPVLLIHGFMGSSYDFHQVMPDLAANRRILAVDLPGFGLSDKSPELDYSKKNMASLMLRFMAALQIEQYVVMGHSMGGEIALRMALDEPQHISRLVLISSGGSRDIQRGFSGTAPEWLLESIFKNYLVQRLYFPLAVGEIRHASASSFDPFFYFNKQIPAATLNQMTRDNDSGAIAGRLGEIGQPTLLVWGDQDRVIPLEQGHTLDERIPDSRLVIYKNCGHLVALEQPAALLADLDDFLAATPD